MNWLGELERLRIGTMGGLMPLANSWGISAQWANHEVTAHERIREHIRIWKTSDVPEMHARLIRCWCRIEAGLWLIVDRHQVERPLEPNESQRRLFAAMLDQALAGKPVRVIILKARKTGLSTLVQIIFCDLAAHCPNQNALTLAHEATATREIFAIATKAAGNYKYADGRKAANPNTWDIEFGGTKSKYRCQTAGAVAVGSGGTPSLLHLSERPKWERNKKETYTSASSALPMNPLTICIDESTAKGLEDFYKTWKAAYDGDHPFVGLFIPWYVDGELQIPVPRGFVRTAKEIELCRRAAEKDGIEISDGALAWRREQIRIQGEAQFRQEFPSTPAEAIQANEGLILPDPEESMVDLLPFVYEQTWPHERVGGIDFGCSDTDATVIWSGIWRGGVLYLTHFWRELRSLAEEQVVGLHKDHVYFCDPTALSWRKELLKAAMLAGVRCRLEPAPRVRHVGENPATTEIHRLASMMQQGKIKILRSQGEQFAIEAGSFCWNERTGKPDDERSESWGHFDSVMALKYLVMGIVRGRPKIEVRTRQTIRGQMRHV